MVVNCTLCRQSTEKHDSMPMYTNVYKCLHLLLDVVLCKTPAHDPRHGALVRLCVLGDEFEKFRLDTNGNEFRSRFFHV